MRKYLAIILGVLFILSFAMVASAEEKTEITLGGKILLRGWLFENVDSANLPTDTKSQALYTTNANITIDAKVSDNVRGFMELETTVGDNTSTGLCSITTSGSCQANRNTGLYYWGTYDTKPNSELFFRQLWIQYTGSGLLGVPSGLKAGHMPLALGEKQFLNHERFGDDAILLWVDPTKELHLALGTTKLSEGTTALGSITSTDDLDGYVLIGTYKLDKDNTVGVNWTWLHSDGNLPYLGTGTNVDELNFHNIGLHANGKVSGVTYAAEADFQFGEATDVSMVSGNDREFSGYGLFAKLGYMLDPVNLRASVAYGSGDDDLLDEDVEEFQTLQGPDAIGPLARFVHYTQIYERTVRTTAQESLVTTTVGGNTRNTGIANTTYCNLGLDVSPVKELSLSLDGFLIYASETPSGVSDSAGTELDFKGTYKIAKNLSYFIEAAAFWPGDYYEDVYGIDKKTVTQVVHGLSLSF